MIDRRKYKFSVRIKAYRRGKVRVRAHWRNYYE